MAVGITQSANLQPDFIPSLECENRKKCPDVTSRRIANAALQ